MPYLRISVQNQKKSTLPFFKIKMGGDNFVTYYDSAIMPTDFRTYCDTSQFSCLSHM